MGGRDAIPPETMEPGDPMPCIRARHATRRATLTAALAFAAAPVAAHPLPPARGAAARAVEQEVTRFREALGAAIQRKDVAKLREVYAESFTHTHGSGRIDGHDARIVSALASEPLIETAPAEELSLRAFGDATAILTGRSPILNRQENRSYDFRWITIYGKTDRGLQLAASQAARLPAPPH